MKISEGCHRCYAERLNVRFGGPPYKVGADELRLDESILNQPLRWKRPRRIFVQSMSDLFEERVPEDWIDQIHGVMAIARQHTFLVLTKRAERMAQWWESKKPKGFVRIGKNEPDLGNLWCGVSCENQARADARIPWLLKTSAAVRFVSLEPLLGSVNLSSWAAGNYLRTVGRDGAAERSGVNWVIVGGESGGSPERALVERLSHAGYDRDVLEWVPKPEAFEWVRSIRDQCQAAGTPFFFKSWGGPTPTSGGRLLDGKEWNEWPQ